MQAHGSLRSQGQQIFCARIPTDDLRQYVADGGNVMGMHTTSDKITLVSCGVPLFHNGKINGAIGVGGGTNEQDLEIVNYVVAKFEEIERK